MRFDRSICEDLSVATQREWLDTNGLGGYASSTLSTMNTRRYHGLLVAATKPPVGRMVLLAKIEETLVFEGQRFELSINQYPGAVHPQGCQYLKEFRLEPFPTWIYEVRGVMLERSVFMVDQENTIVIQYHVSGAQGDCSLELQPLTAFRDYHSMTHENSELDGTVRVEEEGLKLTPYSGVPSLCLAHSSGEIRGPGTWYRNFQYARERERGLDFQEDLYNPFTLVLDLRDRASLIASTEPHRIENVDALRNAELERRRGMDLLTRAAGQFVVARGTGNSVIAGYHWFSDWGRDTMISLPGLTLSTGRYEVAKGILTAFAATVDRGMLPNRFPDAGEAPEYNTVDATLWFFEAARAYLEHTGDLEFILTTLYEVLRDIVVWHCHGTRYGIRMDDDALLMAGQPGVQLTWMDAKIGDCVVTPRRGKPVEIQALWHNALRVMEDLAGRAGHPADSAGYRELADRAKASFTSLFWNAAADCLYDVVNGDVRDSSIRPNQIFAVSLFHKLLSPADAAQVVDTVRRHLLTPFGLRTLAPSDPEYQGRYSGDSRSRDGAYHQGTVWPWLMGPFLEAYIETQGRSSMALEQAREWLAPLRSYLENQGVGQLPEIFEGDAPHKPCGCIAQAWSVAELLRAYCRTVRADGCR